MQWEKRRGQREDTGGVGWEVDPLRGVTYVDPPSKRGVTRPTALEPWQSEGPGARKPRPDKWRAMGRIEHTLLDEGRKSSPTDLRPSPANPPYHKKLTNVSIYAKGPGSR